MRSKATCRPLRGDCSGSVAGGSSTRAADLSSTSRQRRLSQRSVPLLSRLDRQVLEPLETRILMSVSRDVNGYTVVTPAADAAVIYVSTSGSDSNPGTIGAPVATVAKAVSLVQQVHPQTPGGPGFGDQILLRRGDVFKTPILNWTLSGKDTNNPFVLGAYTDPNMPSTDRPKIASGIGTGFTNQATASNHPALSNFDVLGIAFEASDRNYRQPTPNFTVNIKADGSGGTYGMFLLGNISNMAIEDCSFQYYRTGVAVQSVDGWGRPQNISLRRSVVTDQYVVSFDSAGHYVTSEGIYADGVDGLTLDENVFDHNGWMDPTYGNFGAIPSIYNHDAYLNDGSTGVVVTGNIFANASAHGLQARAGGIVKNNLFLNNPIAMSFGFENGHERPGGVFGEISGNIVYGGRDISGQDKGWGLEIGNLMPKSQGGGTVVRDNIMAGYTVNGQPAIQVSFGSNTVNPQTSVGVNDLTMQNNIVYGWTRAFYINPGFSLGGTGRFAYNNVSYINNEFQQIAATPIIFHGPSYNPNVETWRGNRYSIINSAGSSTPYFQLKVNGTVINQTLAQWQTSVEPTASTPSIQYPDPTRSPATYNATKGGDATMDGFMAQARQLSSKFYRSAYMAAAVDDYIKAGYAGQRTDSLPPGGNLTAPTVTAAGGTSTTFTVTWTDDNQVNYTSITDGDVQVTGPNGYSQVASLVSSTSNADGSSVTAVYSVPAASGAWSAAANGSYTVNVRPGEVIDKSGNAVPAGLLGGFVVNIAGNAPSATLAAIPPITNPNTPVTLTVSYAAIGGLVDVSTLDDSDLQVSGPNGFSTTAHFVSVVPGGNSSPAVATYTIDAPGGGWTPDSNGLYQVTVQAGAVTAVGGAAIGTATLGTFKVNVSVPQASSVGPTITAGTSANQTITVTYTDANGILASSVNATDIQVDGTNYFADANSGLTLISKSGAGTPASPLVAKYSIPAPAGGFNESYNGTYHVTLVDGEVQNVGGISANGAVIGTFTVSIDTSGPVAVLAPADVFKPTSAPTKTLTVAYSDPSGVNTSTLGTGDIFISMPDGSNVIPQLQSISGSGTLVSAVYVYDTPGGLDDSADGDYFVYIDDGQVSDNLGNKTQGNFVGSYRVSIDSVPPTASAFAGQVTDAAQDVEIDVTYSDNNGAGVDSNTVDDTDLRIIGPNGFNQPVVLESVDAPSGSDATAVYRLTAPVGGWSMLQNGTYNIVLQAGAVSDLSGNPAVAGTIGTFDVTLDSSVIATFPNISDVMGPTLSQINIHFNQKVTGFNLPDLALSADGSPIPFTAAQTLTTTDNQNFVLSGVSTLLNKSGNYQLVINSAGSGITGQFGSLQQDQNVFFTIDADAPSLNFGGAFVDDPATDPVTFQVTYFDNSGINTNTIGDGDVLVTGPAGSSYNQTAKLVSIDDATFGTVRTATYSVPAPVGGWKPTDNGDYQIRVRNQQVADIYGNFIANGAFVGAMTVSVPVPPDSSGPTGNLQALPVTFANGQAAMFSITWSDPSGVDLSTIGDGDVIVQNTAVGYNTQAKLVAIGTSAGGSVVVTYSVAAPAGGWSSAWNGQYAVLVRNTQVADTLGNFTPNGQFLGALSVNVSSSVADLTPPTATITPATPNPRTTPLDTATIVFSEPVTGFDTSDLSLIGAAAIPSALGSSQSITTADNRTYIVSGLAAVTAVNGTYTLTLASAGTGIVDLQNNALTTGASMSWTLNTTTSSTPVISGVTPNPVIASTSKQNLTINGSGFTASSTVKLKNETSGTTTTASIVSRTATQIVVSNVFGSSASSWSAEVLNGSTSSGKISFAVIPSGALAINVTSGVVKAKTATLSAINGGTSSSTIYTWSATTLPSGASAPTFNANKTNAAKNTTITFSKAGNYTLKLTAVTGSTTKTATLIVTVNQTLTSVAVSPTSATVRWKQTQQITASAKDQFGTAMTTQPAFTWSIDSGGVGTVSSSGLYTAPTGGSGTAKVRATSGSMSAIATITVPSFSSAKVNFQPSSAATVSGYLVDSGKTFAVQGAQQYGWSTSETAQVADRAKNSNQLLDTSVGVLKGAKWEIAVPNGTYSVKISVGDGSKKTTNTVRVEGATAYSATVLNANAYSNKTVSVTVSDGRLTIDNGSGASSLTYINYVEITKTA